MCEKIAVLLALVACIDSHILNREVPVSPESMVQEITAEKGGVEHPLSSVKIDKKDVMFLGEPLTRVPREAGFLMTDIVPTIEPRYFIQSGPVLCPYGYTRVGGFCYPDDDN